MDDSLSGTLRTTDPLRAEWVTVLVVAVLVVLALVHRTAPRKWRLLFGGATRPRLGRQVLRDEIDPQDRGLVALVMVALVVVALVLWQGFVVLRPALVPGFGTVLGAVSMAYLGNLALTAMVRGLFQADGGLAEHRASGTLLLVATALLILPLVVLIAYRPEHRENLVVIAAVVLGLSLLYRWFRGVWIGLGEGTSPAFVFLYLCAAEALPVLLVLHAVLRPTDPSHQP